MITTPLKNEKETMRISETSTNIKAISTLKFKNYTMFCGVPLSNF